MIQGSTSPSTWTRQRVLDQVSVQYNAMFYATPAQFRAFSRNALFAYALLMFNIIVIAHDFSTMAPVVLTLGFPVLIGSLVIARSIQWYRNISAELTSEEITSRIQQSAYVTAGIGMMVLLWAISLSGYYAPIDDNFAPTEPKVLLISSISALIIAILSMPVWGITALVGTAFILPLCVHMALSGWVTYMLSSVLLAAAGLATTFVAMQLSARYREIHYLQSLIKAQNSR